MKKQAFQGLCISEGRAFQASRIVNVMALRWQHAYRVFKGQQRGVITEGLGDTVKMLPFTLHKVGGIAGLWAQECHDLSHVFKGSLQPLFWDCWGQDWKQEDQLVGYGNNPIKRSWGLGRVVAVEVMEVVRFWICIEISTTGVAYVRYCEWERTSD